jgi:hypothetical protein
MRLGDDAWGDPGATGRPVTCTGRNRPERCDALNGYTVFAHGVTCLDLPATLYDPNRRRALAVSSDGLRSQRNE